MSEYISTDNDKPFDKFMIEYVDDTNIKMYHSDKDGFDKILWKRAHSDEINLSSKETSKVFEEWLINNRGRTTFFWGSSLDTVPNPNNNTLRPSRRCTR